MLSRQLPEVFFVLCFPPLFLSSTMTHSICYIVTLNFIIFYIVYDVYWEQLYNMALGTKNILRGEVKRG